MFLFNECQKLTQVVIDKWTKIGPVIIKLAAMLKHNKVVRDQAKCEEIFLYTNTWQQSDEVLAPPQSSHFMKKGSGILVIVHLN